MRIATKALPLYPIPVNRIAARQVVKNPTELGWSLECPDFCKTPLDVIRFRGARKRRVLNLTGFRRGSIEIIGLHSYDGKHSQWIARCDCGRYELRRQKKWLKKYREGIADFCGHCAIVENKEWRAKR